MSSPLNLNPNSSSPSPIERLDDELLVEILHRLSDSKSATLCKCVCKRWFDLINPTSDSDLNFLRRFTRRKTDQDPQEPFCIINTSHIFNEIIPRNIIVPLKENRAFFRSIDNGFSLNFLPCEEPERICILTSSSIGLLVCCPSVFDHSVYFICNPHTKQFLLVPPPPRASQRARSFIDNVKGTSQVGFTYQGSDFDFNFNFVHKFKLVCVPVTSDEVGEDGNVSNYEIEIFSSETWEWTSFVVQRPPNGCPFVQPYNSLVVSCNGIVYWRDHIFIAFNPWDGTCHNIPVPQTVIGLIGCYGVCRGCLRATSLSHDRKSLTVWDLKGGINGEWFVAHEINLKDLTSPPKYSWLMKYAKMGISRRNTLVLGVHPNDGDIVYLICRNCIVMCDMLRRVWKVVGKLPQFKVGRYMLLPLVLPWWPTPVPMPPPKIEREKLTDIPCNMEKPWQWKRKGD